MNTRDLLNIRLYNQRLVGHTFNEPQQVVSWLGAMQSQNYDMAKWGIGLRTTGGTDKQVEAAINAGKIVRTHILRPTWHFVAAEDIHWMLELSAPRVKVAFNSYGKTLGFDDRLHSETNDLLVKILQKTPHQTRQEIGQSLQAAGVRIRDNHELTYVMVRAELDGIVCNGMVCNNKQTYALLHEWVPREKDLSKEESLRKLAGKFFSSHGPATLQDFLWWSGLLTSDAKKAIELIRHEFICEEINGKSYWMKNDIQTPPAQKDSALLLPAFDEFVVSYKDRSEILQEKNYREVITRTGVFSPTITWNGQIIGLWKRIKKSKIEVELTFFEKTDKEIESLFAKQVDAYKKYCDVKDTPIL